MEAQNERRLRRTDYFLLILLCLLYYGIAIVDGRVLTTHEATHCQNVREMVTSGNYLIATYGNRPWLERPPVPHWMTAIPASIVADCTQSWAMRLGSLIVAIVTVLIFSWSVAAAVGRAYGLMSGAILATGREFAAYAVGPEADIFIASTVTIAGCFFLFTEFSNRFPAQSRWAFFGSRPWPVLVFFLIIGSTNSMKGPLFGTAFIASAMFVFFTARREWLGMLRYVWFWGWLGYFAIGLWWPIYAYNKHPDVADVWMHDYGKRWNANYIGEPPWYYLIHVPWNLFPWTVPAFAGLAVTWRQVVREKNRFWQFVWAWALVPPCLFSMFQGKHHHYMLNCIAPWAILSTAGAIAIWQWGLSAPKWWRSPIFGLFTVGLVGVCATFAFRQKIPGPEWVALGVGLGWPALIVALWIVLGKRDGRQAFIGFIAICCVVQVASYLHRTAYLDSYRDDSAFLRDVQETVPPDEPLYILNEAHPLNASWLLYYTDSRSRLLHNITFLASDQITGESIFLIARKSDQVAIEKYGKAMVVRQSSKTRGEASPADRYTLYRLTFHYDLKRYPQPFVNGMQATGRAPGPFVGETQ